MRLTFETKPDGDLHELMTFACATPEWTATGSIGRSWRGLVISRLLIEPDDDVDEEPGSVSSTVLRGIPVGAILAGAQAHVMKRQGAGIGQPDKPAERNRPGRAPLGDSLLREVAEGYLRESAPGKARGAIKRLSEFMGKPEPTVSRWVARARKEGWLGPAIPGREGAEPGPLLIEARAADRPSEA